MRRGGEGRGAARGVGVKLAGLDGTARDGTRMAQPRGHGKGTQRCGTEGLRRPSAMQTRQRERGGGGKAWRGTENKQKPESEGEQIHLLSAEILHVAQIHIRTGQGEPEL